MMAEKLDDNIIIFPKIKKDIPKSNLSEKQKKEIKDMQSQMFVGHLVEAIQDELFKILNSNAIKVDEINFQKDFALVMESIKSLLLRDFNIKHSLQSIVDIMAKAYSADGKILEEKDFNKLGYVQLEYKDILLKQKLKTQDLKPGTIQDIIDLLDKKNKKKEDDDNRIP
jgi:hypothetical protein